MIMIVIKVTQIEWWNYLESVHAWIMAVAAAAAVPGETERIQPPWNSQDRECFRMAYWMLNSNQFNDVSWTRITFWKLVVHHVKLNIPIHAQSWSGLIIDPEKKGFLGKVLKCDSSRIVFVQQQTYFHHSFLHKYQFDNCCALKPICSKLKNTI